MGGRHGGMRCAEEPKKLPEIERVADLTMRLSRPHLADYGATRSRHDFTQRQLMSCLILKAYLKTSYRGVIDWLQGHGALRKALGLDESKPPNRVVATPSPKELPRANLAGQP